MKNKTFLLAISFALASLLPFSSMALFSGCHYLTVTIQNQSNVPLFLSQYHVDQGSLEQPVNQAVINPAGHWSGVMVLDQGSDHGPQADLTISRVFLGHPTQEVASINVKQDLCALKAGEIYTQTSYSYLPINYIVQKGSFGLHGNPGRVTIVFNGGTPPDSKK